MSISSVFTHQRPYITYANGGAAQQCELSDVMIALIDRTNPSNIRSRCIFVQAKRDDSQTITLAQSNDLVQLHLYAQRPSFDVKRRDAPKSIRFPVVASDTALNYGITPPTDIRKRVAPANWGLDRWKLAHNLSGYAGSVIAATVPLQELLVDFLVGNTGFDFVLSSPAASWRDLERSGDSWSALINFILEDAVSSKSPRYASAIWPKRSDGGRSLALTTIDSHGVPCVTVNELSTSGDSPTPTYGMTLFNNVEQHSQSEQEPPHNDPPRDNGERGGDEWGGMSVVVMEMSARDDQAGGD
ncbi:MAG: hypothetical protein KF871_04860 [Hydrogenophaga sp.]|uniref:hypothetical protein n=1 Tax=Hydrogenophaga sp. TaxID=1904254 RepID=UPI001D242151|nr:hypothetical protein [Hydrogenophaga sp.]MBX3609205.1 hypothetical protein [Hydrogenophaga sp.]